MKTKDFRSSGVPVITIQSIGDGELYEPGLFFTSEGKADELSEYSVAEGDLVFSRVADIGRSLTVDARLSGSYFAKPDSEKADDADNSSHRQRKIAAILVARFDDAIEKTQAVIAQVQVVPALVSLSGLLGGQARTDARGACQDGTRGSSRLEIGEIPEE